MLTNREIGERLKIEVKNAIFSKGESLALRKLNSFVSNQKLDNVEKFAKSIRAGVDQYREYIIRKHGNEILEKLLQTEGKKDNRDSQAKLERSLKFKIERSINETLEKIIIEPLYEKIINKFEIKYQGLDNIINKSIQNLSNKRQDFFQIPKKFQPQSQFCHSSQILSSLNAKKLPSEKFQVILKTSNSIFQTVKDECSKPNKEMYLAADDFLPILEFVMIKSKITNLKSQAEFLTAFSDKTEMQNEYGYYFVSFSIAIEHLKTLK